MPEHDVHTARAAFPNGLIQPERGFRFGLDSLLLACFASCRPGDRVLDLGTGCGAVGLGLCLKNMDKDLTVLGLDIQADMVSAATRNAQRLGLEGMYSAQQGDVCAHRINPDIQPESFDLVICNPPYRRGNQGRKPKDLGRRRACFEESTEIADFMRAAFYALKNRGRVNLVYLIERMATLFHVLAECKLEPKHLRLVHRAQNCPANLVLLTATKGSRPGLQVHPPLFLDCPQELSVFCPLLPAATCNPGQIRTP